MLQLFNNEIVNVFDKLTIPELTSFIATAATAIRCRVSFLSVYQTSSLHVSALIKLNRDLNFILNSETNKEFLELTTLICIATTVLRTKLEQLYDL